MNSSLYSILILPIIVASCASKTKTTNVVNSATNTIAFVGAVASGSPLPVGGIPINPPLVKHQLQIKGAIICESNQWPRFQNLKVQIVDSSNQISVLKIDVLGVYNETKNSSLGMHTLRLIDERTNKVLDQVHFQSTAEQDRFELNLRYCQ